jgi:predicted ATPase
MRKVTLERFKAAFQPEPVQLEPFTVIIGRNGVGKSTLLEALQWLDTTMRQDAREACSRYRGVHDLINLRARTNPLWFRLTLEWETRPTASDQAPLVWAYSVKVAEDQDGSSPTIAEEHLFIPPGKKHDPWWIWPAKGEPGVRVVRAGEGQETRFDEADRLALRRGARLAGAADDPSDPFGPLQDFWSRAVFLRLSPNRLAEESGVRRKSYEPMLDEEGHRLPALLTELGDDGRAELASTLRHVLPGIEDVDVTEPGHYKEAPVSYSLEERMPYVGRKGRKLFPIPAWMLSEGTRRLIAIFALLERDPPPSLLCIEEIENGLDPWTVVQVLNRLRSGADRGIQVIVTSHSPWLLDHVPLHAIVEVRRAEGETRFERFQDRDEVKRFQGRVPPGAIYANEVD